MAKVYTVLATPDRWGNREEIGSFPRKEDAILASKIWEDGLVVEDVDFISSCTFLDFGQFDNWAASALPEYDTFFENFLNLNEGKVWENDEEREEDFRQWWYSL